MPLGILATGALLHSKPFEVGLASGHGVWTNYKQPNLRTVPNSLSRYKLISQFLKRLSIETKTEPGELLFLNCHAEEQCIRWSWR